MLSVFNSANKTWVIDGLSNHNIINIPDKEDLIFAAKLYINLSILFAIVGSISIIAGLVIKIK